MVLYNSEMSKNISFHVALCAKGLTKDGERETAWRIESFPWWGV